MVGKCLLITLRLVDIAIYTDHWSFLKIRYTGHIIETYNVQKFNPERSGSFVDIFAIPTKSGDHISSGNIHKDGCAYFRSSEHALPSLPLTGWVAGDVKEDTLVVQQREALLLLLFACSEFLLLDLKSIRSW
uniref:LTD domain-containing protein n=1 Tax=Steinernema glaseri TaxID=37863 RepID=A0A1I7ZM54_9BILA